ncbi:hypothetical protein TNCV_3083001 [Trichonephila clavipes]|nr:hypothetical protein TNCV_3083001 [Trichonephila clavipes]
MRGRKGSTTGNVHRGRNKKGKFSGNRFTTQNDTSARKLKSSMNTEVPIAPSFAYCTLDFVLVFYAISETKRDETRISHSERRKRDAVEQEGIDTRAEQSALKEFQEEGVLYGPGVADRG